MSERERHAEEKDAVKNKIRERYKGINKEELEFIPALPKKKLFEDTAEKRVCAYCRVSTDDAKQTSSYELQKNHYEEMIQEHKGWRLVGIYADEGISGTSLEHRDEFLRMIEDCKAGKIDLIITKSVSRFARNIVDCIAQQRFLANLPSPVGVFFETEHIYSLDGTGEMMMAVLAAAAQEESHTKSEIMNISIEQRFSRGIFLTPELLGYDVNQDGELVINEEEADTVRFCFYMFLAGHRSKEIARYLTELGRKTKIGNTKWSASTVINLLRNERYCGDILSRKTYTPSYLDHKAKKNRQNRNQYRQKDHHEPIVKREIYEAAQELIDSYKYNRKSHALPTLQVIDGGALKGFVPINRTWQGFTSADYVTASRSAYKAMEEKQEPLKTEIEKKAENTVAFSGYQIVRVQFFSTKLEPALTISNGKLIFNTACLRKFQDVEYVELLLNTEEKCLAIRPCSADNLNAIRWGMLQNNRWKVLPKSSKGFSSALYDLMSWEHTLRYRFRGRYRESDDGKMMLFDLEEPEVLKIRETVTETEDNEREAVINSETGKIKEKNISVSKRLRNTNRIHWLYPVKWRQEFGVRVENECITFLERIPHQGNWEILRPAVTIEGHQKLTREYIDELSIQATEMLDNMRKVI